MRVLSVSIFALLLAAVVYVTSSPDELGFFERIFRKPQGSITVVNVDAVTKAPIRGTEYAIRKPGSPEVLQTIVTDDTGRATSQPFDIGTSLEVVQTKIMHPYERNEPPVSVDVAEKSSALNTTNRMFDYVTKVERATDGSINVQGVRIKLDAVIQLPELPNGCEITSLTAVLRYYGFDVSKTEMSDGYLKKEPFATKQGKRYGANPFKAYAGEPRDKRGFFSFAPPIVEAADKYLQEAGQTIRAEDITGSSRDELIGHLKRGIPVVTWVTLDLSKPKLNYSWYLNDTGELFKAPINLHTVVLTGYGDGEVYVMNPLKGQVSYKADDFFRSYEEMGKRAVIVEKPV